MKNKTTKELLIDLIELNEISGKIEKLYSGEDIMRLVLILIQETEQVLNTRARKLLKEYTEVDVPVEDECTCKVDVPVEDECTCSRCTTRRYMSALNEK
jgi:hypothetical protein